MILKAIFIEFLNNLKRQKLRTFLTLFGIIWGTVAVIVLLAFGTGFRQQTSKNMHGIGEQIILIFNGRTTKPFQGYGIGRYIQMKEEDAILLTRDIPEIAAISPEYSTWNFPIKKDEKSMTANVTGIYPVYEFLRNIIPSPGGRFINENDQNNKRKVVVLGNRLKDYLFENENAVGKYVLIGDIPFKVVGVMLEKRQNSSYNSRDQDRAFIPATTFSSILGYQFISNLVIKPTDARLSEQIQTQIFQILGKKYKFDPTDKNALWVWDTSMFDKILIYFFLSFNIFMGMIGALTLIVGGIGVANIMFVAVKERTQEIGIKLAVGAYKRDILMQFFIEAIMIVLTGAIIGFLLSIGIVKIASGLPIQEEVGIPQISHTVVIVTILLISGVGVIAAYFPARRAAQLKPIECFRV